MAVKRYKPTSPARRQVRFPTPGVFCGTTGRKKQLTSLRSAENLTAAEVWASKFSSSDAAGLPHLSVNINILVNTYSTLKYSITIISSGPILK